MVYAATEHVFQLLLERNDSLFSPVAGITSAGLYFDILAIALIILGLVVGFLQGSIAWDMTYGNRVRRTNRQSTRLVRMPLFLLLIIVVGLFTVTFDPFDVRAFMARHTSNDTLTGDVASAGAYTSGIRGIVIVSDTCSKQRLATSSLGCVERPYETELAIFQGLRVIKVVTSSGNGEFSAVLGEGEYEIGQLPDSPPRPSLKKVPFRVVPKEFVDVKLRFESGV